MNENLNNLILEFLFKIFPLPCGEEICRSDCEVCRILIHDKMNKTYKAEQHNDNSANLKGGECKR